MITSVIQTIERFFTEKTQVLQMNTTSGNILYHLSWIAQVVYEEVKGDGESIEYYNNIINKEVREIPSIHKS